MLHNDSQSRSSKSCISSCSVFFRCHQCLYLYLCIYPDWDQMAAHPWTIDEPSHPNRRAIYMASIRFAMDHRWTIDGTMLTCRRWTIAMLHSVSKSFFQGLFFMRLPRSLRKPLKPKTQCGMIMHDTAVKTHNGNFAEFESEFLPLMGLDGSSMGRRWGAVWASNFTPRMDHGWAIDGHAWELMGS